MTFCGLEWEVVYLSKDKDGNSILTLWLNSNQQGWRSRQFSSEYAEYYGFLSGGLYSDWSANWIESNPIATLPSNMYGSSYVRAVTLNNGGFYVADGYQAPVLGEKNSSSVFAKFTMEDVADSVTAFLIKPERVQWQEYGQNTRQKGMYSSSNENYSANIPDDGAYMGQNYKFGTTSISGESIYFNYAQNPSNGVWASDYIWLPSLSETGCSPVWTGLWALSDEQRQNYDAATKELPEKVGSGNMFGSVKNYSWLRSAYVTNSLSAYALSVNGTSFESGSVMTSAAVRPALHLNIDQVASSLIPWDGSGMENSPYRISTRADLETIAENVNAGEDFSDKYFIQMKNINLSGSNWTPIGKSNAMPFAGHYNGQNYAIEGINIDSTGDYQGLFGYVNGGTIQNVVIQSGNISGRQYVGGIAGYFGPQVKIDSCKNYADIHGANNVGGIVGCSYEQGVSITNCVNAGKIIGHEKCGGIVGCVHSGANNSNFVLKNCVNQGDVSGSDGVGGLLGEIDSANGAEIDSNISRAIVSADSSGLRLGCGGLVGHIANATVINCCAFGTVNTYSNTRVGGLVGFIYGYTHNAIVACSFYGTSNQALNLYETQDNSAVVVESWQKCNDVVSLSSSITSSWSTYWAVAEGFNDNLPLLRALYWEAIIGDNSVAAIQNALK